ncbi:DUF4241 domain-containing protein [Longimicrobium sp.]|uniref:DUF4241 domain-containing protein n=1 Tax=Longimicrobium sp. TaxID=2029185 RepID=UPI0039C93E0F
MIDLSAAFTEGNDGGRRERQPLPPFAGRPGAAPGRMVACDPLPAEEDPPYTRGVPPGRYPVLVNVARIDVLRRVHLPHGNAAHT